MQHSMRAGRWSAAAETGNLLDRIVQGAGLA